ncbi:inositol monophosphatase family protein [Synechococcus sp. Tobar12-5m-g]|uniref:inositol monophosphatase family protein n=1 Tax=unclassified Synechococcus TaxID=2626047 RepID=UPI0020CC8F91|nr:MULTISPECIES: inositol monophosphatase family protein [unclassified Synechococcus]MCP9772474.1 inositol monophosphatase family protein [Synechococcus sp. Tobar12-5m-g]MCP9873313.1 inositol monophosphatase family protein [Synechococcus sp. Cruz CV-v-12]
MNPPHPSTPPLEAWPIQALLDDVASRQRLDFGHMAAEAKADGSLITACDRWSDHTLVHGLDQLYPGEGVLSEEGDKIIPGSPAFWVVDPLDGTTNFAAGIPYWAISLARFEAGVPVLAILDVPPLRQRIVAVRGQGAWRNGKRLEPPSSHGQLIGCASLCSRSIGVLQKLPDRRFPGKIRLLGVASLNLVSVAMGQTVAALEATPKIWDLAAAWLVLTELGCPLRWLVNSPEHLEAGENHADTDFPVLAARDRATLEIFLPWAEALVGEGGDV